jgi:hypothetical protein
MVRVEVTNQSGMGVQRVRSYMRVLQGHGRSHFLHLEHDNEPQYLASRNGEYLTVGQTAHFDVAAVTLLGEFFFCYADSGLTSLSLGQRPEGASWRLRIEASGWSDFRDVVPTSTEYRLTLDDQHELSFTTL